jgi:hypothetical protein
MIIVEQAAVCKQIKHPIWIWWIVASVLPTNQGDKRKVFTSNGIKIVSDSNLTLFKIPASNNVKHLLKNKQIVWLLS